jgi:hypothetical protein
MPRDTPKRMGRPPKAEKDKRDAILRVCLTDRERKAISAAARSDGLDASVWARQQLLERAQKKPPP